MRRNGLGENTEFAGYHPLVNILYFVLMIGVTMFSLSPYFLAVTVIFSWSYAFILKGTDGMKFNLMMCLSVLVIMVIMNGLFVNNGETVLFYLNINRITLEAIISGLASAVMLTSVLVWFSCFNVIFTADKVIYLFGRIAPVLGLTLSMIFRFIPLLKSRFAEISLGQKCMGVSRSSGSLIKKARQLMKEISILIAWSLEASIESADSMEARGYGLHGRTSFHLFKLTGRDIAALIFMLITGLPVVIGAFAGMTDMYFYPKIVVPAPDMTTAVLLVCYCIFAATPIVIDIAGEIRWRQLDLKM